MSCMTKAGKSLLASSLFVFQSTILRTIVAPRSSFSATARLIILDSGRTISSATRFTSGISTISVSWARRTSSFCACLSSRKRTNCGEIIEQSGRRRRPSQRASSAFHSSTILSIGLPREVIATKSKHWISATNPGSTI